MPEQSSARPEIEAITIGLLSSEKALSLSNGEVTGPKTIDIKTGMPVSGGLMCQRIFGPVHKGVCACGKFHKGHEKRLIECPECKVIICDPRERRRRFGHIELAAPVVHPWYRQHIATLLSIPPRKLDQIIDCLAYMITRPGKSGYKKSEVINRTEYFKYTLEAKEDSGFEASTGAKLIARMLEDLDLHALIKDLRARTPSRRVNKRLMLARDLSNSGSSPRSMLIENLLVLPPDLRPVIVFDDGTTASSDLNDLYSRIIHRNNRLRIFCGMYDYEGKNEGICAPDVVIANEMRLLQEAVDALINNEKRGGATNRFGKKVLKSLSGMIEKKEGRIRRNLLGKRVDYSGRSVIAPGPDLKLNQCGLPLDLAMDMFRPFVYGRLRRIGYASSLKHARTMVEERVPAALEALEYEIAEKTVLLNRAPSLHRMSIQAFSPVLVTGRAIRLHPLVCSAFNADFDGDQMGVHIPVTLEAQIESTLLMLSVNNIISPANGKLSVSPSQDIVIGVYYLTKNRANVKGTGKCFADKDDVLMAYDREIVDLQAVVRVRIDDQLVETTTGRVLFSEIFPPEIPFGTLNRTMKKKDLGMLLETCYEKVGPAPTVTILDKIKDIGFKFATLAGISLCMDDLTVPTEKQAIIHEAEERVGEITSRYAKGMLTDEEKHNSVIDTWMTASESIAAKMMENFGIHENQGLSAGERIEMKEFNSVFMMADSGAKSSRDQIRQVAGMRGLMAKPTGEIIEIPIKSNFKEGLLYHEFLLSCHGARKGRADGALKTANAGYFTRRLVDVAHDVIINDMDCGALKGFVLSALYDGDELLIPVADRALGRVTVKTIVDPSTGQRIAGPNEIITKAMAETIRQTGITEIEVRSPITCNLKKGICAMCYGYDLSKRALAEVGDAVGIIAAQSLGEPGTQLTLRTFHSGGAASGQSAISVLRAKDEGSVKFIDVKTLRAGDREIVISRTGKAIVDRNGVERDIGRVPYGSVLYVTDRSLLKRGEKVAEWDPFQKPIICISEGKVIFEDIVENVTMRKETDDKTGITLRFIIAISKEFVPRIVVGESEYVLPIGAFLAVDEGEIAQVGDVLAKLPKKASVSSDITGGLSRVLQILEVRRLKDPAVMAEIDGKLAVHPPKRQKIPFEIVAEDGTSRIYHIPIEKQLNFYSGELVKAGDILVDGIVDARDILTILGTDKTAAHVIDEVQKVYRSQGVEINDKHLEIVLSKMLGKVQITDAGDTDLVVDEVISRNAFIEENGKVSGKRATAKPVILSITKAALLSDSWLSAASFQNTTSVLANAAIRKSRDALCGTKENIIVGNIVPVGTGHETYRTTRLVNEKSEKEVKEERRKNKAYERFLRLFRGD